MLCSLKHDKSSEHPSNAFQDAPLIILLLVFPEKSYSTSPSPDINEYSAKVFSSTTFDKFSISS